MPNPLYQWIDFLWLPIGWFAVHPPQRAKTAGFILACLFTLRTQVELAGVMGFAEGVTGWIDMGLLMRGQIVYSIVIAAFLLLAHFSPRTKGAIFLAAALSVYILSFCVSMVFMVL